MTHITEKKLKEWDQLDNITIVRELMAEVRRLQKELKDSEKKIEQLQYLYSLKNSGNICT